MVNTANKAFNENWDYLSRVLPSAKLPSGESLDLRKRPKLPHRTRREWMAFTDALVEVLGIGLRNGWVHVHVGYSGVGRFLYVPNKIANPRGVAPSGEGALLGD